MAKPRIIIADTDENFIFPVQLKFAEEFFDQLDIEVITDAAYFREVFSTPQQAGILIVSQDLYSMDLHRHNIAHVFVMTEQDDDYTAQLNASYIHKYTGIMPIFNEITAKSADVLHVQIRAKQDTQIILVCAACGGVGKTTVAMGISAALTKNFKRVLYIDAERLQSFQHMLENRTPIAALDVYAKLHAPTEEIYDQIKHVIRKEAFAYLPPFKAALMSLGLKFDVFAQIAEAAKKSRDYDYIIIDTDAEFDEYKAQLLNLADRVILVTKQTRASICATNVMVSNINGINGEKYLFICNDFDKEADNALIRPDLKLKFSVSDYINHFAGYDQMRMEELAQEASMQRVAFLIL